VRDALRSFVRGPLTELAIERGHLALLALGRSWNVRHVGRARVDAARFGCGPILFAFTHGVLLPLAYSHRRRAIQVLISESRDGEIIARVTGKLGFGSVRGSSTRGGQRAVLQMAACGREGFDLAITPDGPKGPRGSVSPGVIAVAARSGLPIIPVGVAADRAHRARSWDRFLVPLPFARVWVVYGAALRIEGANGADDSSAACAELGRALAAAEEEAQAYAARSRTPEDALRVPA
jgi:lysophospholipid acyltransferase (LPLAT)-like uncharacterized protein